MRACGSVSRKGLPIVLHPIEQQSVHWQRRFLPPAAWHAWRGSSKLKRVFTFPNVTSIPSAHVATGFTTPRKAIMLRIFFLVFSQLIVGGLALMRLVPAAEIGKGFF